MRLYRVYYSDLKRYSPKVFRFYAEAVDYAIKFNANAIVLFEN